MAHVIHSINSTLSGLCHHMDSVIDDAHHQYAIDLTLSAEAMLLGRNTYDLFLDFWPGAIDRNDLPGNTIALAKAFHSIPKLVVSNRPIELIWHNTKRIPGPGVEGIGQELRKLAGTVVIFGSPSLGSSLLNGGLVNEIHLLAQPLIGVEDPQAFSSLEQRVSLRLQGVDPFSSGSVLLQYKVIYQA